MVWSLLYEQEGGLGRTLDHSTGKLYKNIYFLFYFINCIMQKSAKCIMSTEDSNVLKRCLLVSVLIHMHFALFAQWNL